MILNVSLAPRRRKRTKTRTRRCFAKFSPLKECDVLPADTDTRASGRAGSLALGKANRVKHQAAWSRSTRSTGERGGARAGRPRCVRILTITAGIFDRGDDLQTLATVRAMLDVDVKDLLEQTRPTHAQNDRWYCAPSSTKRSTVRRPMPLVAPVTSATLPVSMPIAASRELCCSWRARKCARCRF